MGGLLAVAIERDVRARMADGVTLSADVYRPDGRGKFPVILLRVPYDKGEEAGSLALPSDYGHFFAQRGYVVAIQEVRGRFGSGGDFYPIVHEQTDGYQSVEWAARLPWSNGKVATAGQAYAYTQYLTAATRPPHLKTMVPMAASSDLLESEVYQSGGPLWLAYTLSYSTGLARETARRIGKDPEFVAWMDGLFAAGSRGPFKDEHLRRLPLKEWCDRLGEVAPYLRDFILNPDDGPLWWQTSVRRHFPLIGVPMLHITSWYDLFMEGALACYRGITDHGATPLARRSQRLFIGPWSHLVPYTKPTTRGCGEADFGPKSAVNVHDLELRWFDHWLKGVDNDVMDRPPVRIFVMGVNRWRDEADWPLPDTRYVKWYLHSGGSANTFNGDGTLSPSAPEAEPGDQFVYDPHNPVPTRGGAVLIVPAGVFDQRPVEQRPDVLVYTSAPLDRDLEVTGPIKVELYAASSAADTDFTAKLVDVHPDGYASNLRDGAIRARYRESRSRPSLIEPGRTYRYTIDLWATSNVFLKGHRIRLEVSSSNFPWLDRNPNTGRSIPLETELVAARQTIYHDAEHPSHVLLPLVER